MWREVLPQRVKAHDVTAAATRGIVVTNTPDVLTGATAQLTWALILAVPRRPGAGERGTRRAAWTGCTFDCMLRS